MWLLHNLDIALIYMHNNKNKREATILKLLAQAEVKIFGVCSVFMVNQVLLFLKTEIGGYAGIKAASLHPVTTFYCSENKALLYLDAIPAEIQWKD